MNSTKYRMGSRKASSLSLVLVLCLTGLFLFQEHVSADFEDTGYGARPIAMGNAFTAIADDVDAVYYNPAGLSRLGQMQLLSGYGRLYWGLTDGSDLGNGLIAYGQPLGKFGSIAVSYLNSSLPDYYAENTFTFGWGAHFGPLLKMPLSLGLSAKLLNKMYTANDYTENGVLETGFLTGQKDQVFKDGYGKTAFGIDFGLLYDIGDEWSIGLALLNINQPHTDLQDTDTRLASLTRMGFSWHKPEVALTGDLQMKAQDIALSFGGERWFFRQALGVRGGLCFGSRELANLAVGASYGHRVFRVDYAFLYPLAGIRGTAGSHRLSLLFRFGPTASITAPEIPGIVIPGRTGLTAEAKEKLMRNYYSNGLEYYYNGQYEKAIEMWEKIQELEPGHQQSLERIKRAKEMLGLSEEERKLRFMKECYGLGTSYFQRGDYEKAIKEFEKILAIDPNHAQSKRMLERCRDAIRE